MLTILCLQMPLIVNYQSTNLAIYDIAIDRPGRLFYLYRMRLHFQPGDLGSNSRLGLLDSIQ